MDAISVGASRQHGIGGLRRPGATGRLGDLRLSRTNVLEGGLPIGLGVLYYPGNICVLLAVLRSFESAQKSKVPETRYGRFVLTVFGRFGITDRVDSASARAASCVGLSP